MRQPDEEVIDERRIIERVIERGIERGTAESRSRNIVDTLLIAAVCGLIGVVWNMSNTLSSLTAKVDMLIAAQRTTK